MFSVDWLLARQAQFGDLSPQGNRMLRIRRQSLPAYFGQTASAIAATGR